MLSSYFAMVKKKLAGWRHLKEFCSLYSVFGDRTSPPRMLLHATFLVVTKDKTRFQPTRTGWGNLAADVYVIRFHKFGPTVEHSPCP